MTRAWCGPMADPTIPELLRAVFEIERERSEDGPFTLDLPDDIAGQGRCIRHLAEMAANPALPYEVQAWAYDKLEEIARDYREKGELGSDRARNVCVVPSPWWRKSLSVPSEKARPTRLDNSRAATA